MRAFYQSETPLSSLQSDIISLYRHRQAHYASSGIWKLWKILGKIFSALKHNKSEKSRKWESLENTLSLCASTQFYRKVSFQQAPDTFHVLIPQDVYYAGIMQNNAIVVIVAVFIFRLLKKLSMIFFTIKTTEIFHFWNLSWEIFISLAVWNKHLLSEYAVNFPHQNVAEMQSKTRQPEAKQKIFRACKLFNLTFHIRLF